MFQINYLDNTKEDNFAAENDALKKKVAVLEEELSNQDSTNILKDNYIIELIQKNNALQKAVDGLSAKNSQVANSSNSLAPQKKNSAIALHVKTADGTLDDCLLVDLCESFKFIRQTILARNRNVFRRQNPAFLICGRHIVDETVTLASLGLTEANDVELLTVVLN